MRSLHIATREGPLLATTKEKHAQQQKPSTAQNKYNLQFLKIKSINCFKDQEEEGRKGERGKGRREKDGGRGDIAWFHISSERT